MGRTIDFKLNIVLTEGHGFGTVNINVDCHVILFLNGCDQKLFMRLPSGGDSHVLRSDKF